MVCTAQPSKPPSRVRADRGWQPEMTAEYAAEPGLRHRAVAELVGTAFLVAAVVGSGIAAQRLSPDNVGLQLLENAVATGAALAALIVALQPISAAFNPIVTALERLARAITGRQALMIVGAQIIGGMIGVVLANLMFEETPVSLSTTERAGPGRWLAEVVATAGLVLLITALSRAGRPQLIGWAVGGLHHRRLLVHQLHQLRQSSCHLRADVFRHIRRHPALIGTDVPARPGRRWRRRLQPRPSHLPTVDLHRNHPGDAYELEPTGNHSADC